MALKLTLTKGWPVAPVAFDSVTGPRSEIKKFIEFRKAFFFTDETWGYHYESDTWYVVAKDEFMEAWNLWENVHNT